MKGWNCRPNQFDILIENPNEQFRESADYNPYYKLIGKTNMRHKPNGFLHQIIFPGAIIVTDNRR